MKPEKFPCYGRPDNSTLVVLFTGYTSEDKVTASGKVVVDETPPEGDVGGTYHDWDISKFNECPAPEEKVQ